MANRQFPYTPELKPFQDADDAWDAELRRKFGKSAGDARYEARGKGEEGSELRRACVMLGRRHVGHGTRSRIIHNPNSPAPTKRQLARLDWRAFCCSRKRD